jgi:hypothetical protein
LFFFMTIPPAKPLDAISFSSLVAVTQATVGCGVGLLIAGKLRPDVQRTTAVTMLSVGLLSTLPLAYHIYARCMNRPGSRRFMRRRLESIRDDSGLPDDAEIF